MRHIYSIMSIKHLTAFCLSVALSVGATTASAQGDSDPGFASIGAMRTASSLVVSDDNYENSRTHFSLGHTFAKGERDIKLHMPQVEVRVPLMEGMGYIDVRVPFIAASGDLGHGWGLGDLSLAYTHVFVQDPEWWTVQATAGALLSMTTANRSDGNTRPLPMAYQSGLGSTDGILGASAMFKEYVSVAVGYQQPVFRYNQNDYYRSTYMNDPVYSNSEYEISRKLYRNGDVMARLEGHLVNNRLGITGGALAMYHLRNDLYEDRTGAWREIDGSDGFTMSIVGNAFVRFGRYADCKLDITGSFPVITRDARPDGLQRQWTIMPRFTYFFNQRNLLF